MFHELNVDFSADFVKCLPGDIIDTQIMSIICIYSITKCKAEQSEAVISLYKAVFVFKEVIVTSLSTGNGRLCFQTATQKVRTSRQLKGFREYTAANSVNLTPQTMFLSKLTVPISLAEFIRIP